MSNREYKPLIRLGLPVLVSQLGVITVTFADTMMVGRHLTAELSAAAFVNSLFIVPTVMLIGFANGLTPLVGAFFGRKDLHGAGQTMRGGLIANLSLGVIFTILMAIMYLFLPLFGQDPQLMPIIRPYYIIMLMSLIPMSIFNAMCQTSNGSACTSMPMWMMLMANAINILGNWLLIFGCPTLGVPELGLLGAGISTTVARSMGALGMCIIIATARRFEGHRQGWKEYGRLPLRRRGAILKRVAVTSLPIMVQGGVECGLWSVGAVVCGAFPNGAVQIASYQVVNTVAQLGFMIYMSFTSAAAIRSANYTGVSDYQGVQRVAVATLNIVMVLATAASILFIVWGKTLISLFTTDTAVIEAGDLLIIPLVLYQYGDAAQLVYCNMLRGMAAVKPLLWVSVLSYVVVGIPAQLLLGRGTSLEHVGVFYSFSIALFLAATLYYICYRRALRRRRAEIL